MNQFKVVVFTIFAALMVVCTLINVKAYRDRHNKESLWVAAICGFGAVVDVLNVAIAIYFLSGH